MNKCDWATEKIDQISDQHAQQFTAKLARLSASRINCGRRSLRRALNLAFEWGKLERPAKITLAKGEKQRDRVLTDSEWEQYIVDCPQPWRDAATIVRGERMRPGEVFPLSLNGGSGLIQLTDGKTKTARRMLLMVPAVYAARKRVGRNQENPNRVGCFLLIPVKATSTTTRRKITTKKPLIRPTRRRGKAERGN